MGLVNLSVKKKIKRGTRLKDCFFGGYFLLNLLLLVQHWLLLSEYPLSAKWNVNGENDTTHIIMDHGNECRVILVHWCHGTTVTVWTGLITPTQAATRRQTLGGATGSPTGRQGH